MSHSIDLPPSTLAAPLPTSKSAASNGIFTSLDKKNTTKKRKRKDTDDDTPKAFVRLMAFTQGKKLPKGLDDGVKETKTAMKKRRKAEKDAEAEQAEGDGAAKQKAVAPVKEKVAPETETPTIRPGEKMSEFSARVDAALPVSGLINKSVRGANGKDPLGLKVGRTKTERKMHRMYDEWRLEEAKIQDRRLEAQELAEEEESDEDGQVGWKRDMPVQESGKGKKKKGKKGRRKVAGEIDDGEADPWAAIARERGGKVGLNDIVQAPPVFTKIPKEKFKISKGVKVEVSDVPNASGSLRRREELGEVRKSVVEGYRAMMKERAAEAKAESK